MVNAGARESKTHTAIRDGPVPSEQNCISSITDAQHFHSIHSSSFTDEQHFLWHDVENVTVALLFKSLLFTA